MEVKGVVGASGPKWISVKYSLPEPHVPVLIVTKTGRIDMDETFMKREGTRSWCGYVEGLITHWMPLPAPPKAGD